MRNMDLNSNRDAQYRRVQIIFGESIYSFLILEHWSINKIKCLIATQIPKLDFDEFQLSLQKNLLRGNYSLKQVIQGIGQTQLKKIELEIIRTPSQIKFKEYYTEKMGKILKIAQRGDQPVLNISYQRSYNLINKSQQEIEEENNANAEMREQQLRQIAGEQNQQPRLFRVLRVFGLYFFFSILKNYGSLYQVGLIIFVVFLYAMIEWQRRVNIRHIQRNNNQQNPPRNQQANANRAPQNNQKLNQIKAEILLRGFKSIQIIYVFMFSFFPNWDIHVHLHRNADYLKKAQSMVNRYREKTYPTDQVNQNQLNDGNQEAPQHHDNQFVPDQNSQQQKQIEQVKE